MLIELMNDQIRAVGSGFVTINHRIVAIQNQQEIHSDQIMRACSGEALANDGKAPSKLGFIVEWKSKENRQFLVKEANLERLRADFAPKPAPAIPSPAVSNPDSIQSQKLKLSAEYSKCMEGKTNMPDMIDCSVEEAERQDARLKVAFKAAEDSVQDKEALKAEQQAWRDRRNKTCAIDPDAGQNAQLIAADCMAQEIAKRSAELEAMK